MVLRTLPLVLKTTEVHFTDKQFYQLCRSNPDLSIEQSATRALIVMAPVGGEGVTLRCLGGELDLWNKQSVRRKYSVHPPYSNCPMADRSPDAPWLEQPLGQTLSRTMTQIPPLPLTL